MLDVKEVYDNLKNVDSEAFIDFINKNSYRYVRIIDSHFGSYIAASNSNCEYIDICCNKLPDHIGGLISDKVVTINNKDFSPSLIVVSEYAPEALNFNSDVLLTNSATTNRNLIQTLLKANLCPLQAYPFYGGSILFSKMQTGIYLNFTESGPGTELKNILAICGIKAGRTCGCDTYRKIMDMFGCEWSRNNIEHILNWLAGEAKKRKLPFFRKGAYALVRLAIFKASFYQKGGELCYPESFS